MYQVKVTRTAIKERDRLDAQIRSRIDDVLRQLPENPRPAGVKKLSGRSHDWRIRVGDYRILYEIDDADMVVTVWRIRHRRQAYQP
jgi:mRNA interferase RelE/StbE